MSTDLVRLRSVVERFVASAQRPAVLDPGEEPLALVPDHWNLSEWNGRLVLQAWDNERNLVRKITGIAEEKRDRLALTVERFPKSKIEMQLADLGAPLGRDLERKGSKAAFRERFGLMLAREFPAWRVEEISCEPNLEDSLSPAYLRAMLRKGSTAMGVLAVPPDCGDPAGVVPFGVIWRDYLRRRERTRQVAALLLFCPVQQESEVAARASALRAEIACELFVYDEKGRCGPVDFADAGNVKSTLPPARQPSNPNAEHPIFPDLPDVERVGQSDGSISFRVRGLEFARWTAGKLSCGVGRRRRCALSDVISLGCELARVRAPDAEDRQHPLYLQYPEGWLESQVRQQPGAVDALLLGGPIYGQVPVIGGAERGVIDLLGVDHTGRLVVIELKITADPRLPFQAIDYWLRVRKHLFAGDFESLGYFGGVVLRREPPRILLVAPALEFHSTSETIIAALDPQIEVTRVGLAADWRKHLQIMFRLQGAEHPQ
ncbi:MAG: hypothetical protein JWN34_521 [Bryobacterales bacterium]|nr:hypothetical protein [Bryobacterales bacterium]